MSFPRLILDPPPCSAPLARLTAANIYSWPRFCWARRSSRLPFAPFFGGGRIRATRKMIYRPIIAHPGTHRLIRRKGTEPTRLLDPTPPQRRRNSRPMEFHLEKAPFIARRAADREQPSLWFSTAKHPRTHSDQQHSQNFPYLNDRN